MQANKQISVAIAIIKDGDKLFLIKRNDPGTNEHEKYEFPGGKIEFGESPEQAIIREVKEETGFDVKVSGLYPKVFSQIFPPNARHPDYALNVLLIVYFCEIISGEFKAHGREVFEGRYFSESELDFEKCMEPIQEIFKSLH